MQIAEHVHIISDTLSFHFVIAYPSSLSLRAEGVAISVANEVKQSREIAELVLSVSEESRSEFASAHPRKDR